MTTHGNYVGLFDHGHMTIISLVDMLVNLVFNELMQDVC